ncbi:nuclease-related domain-containing protein [Streptomyces sp. NPDC059582]|uniref:nuclease-related domain-containing protein n=1 Tax=Streptomyces sp. NPDC059582 TaxID=3346875 RepID=UPI0036A82B57
MSAGRSPMEWAARERARARRGIRRRVLAWVGLNKQARAADALAVRAAHGAVAEQWTAALLTRLPAGWTVLHGRRLTGFANDYDHVLASPCGTAVVVLDSKRWHFQWPTHLKGGRVHCGGQDRHGQVEAVARYANRLRDALGVPGVVVWPLLVVHGSQIVGGRLEAAVEGWEGPVHVLGPEFLVPTLARAPKERDPQRAADLAARVARVLPPHRG